jgi:hypothetical protein
MAAAETMATLTALRRKFFVHWRWMVHLHRQSVVVVLWAMRVCRSHFFTTHNFGHLSQNMMTKIIAFKHREYAWRIVNLPINFPLLEQQVQIVYGHSRT